jgi:ketosteroid isomerase-like protein
MFAAGAAVQISETTYKLDTLDRKQIDREIRAFWQDRLINGPAAARKYFADDVEFRIMGGPQSLPGPRIFSGIDAVVQAINFIDANLEFLSFQILDLIIDGSHVALRWHATFRNYGTGVIGNLAVLDHIIVRNGKVVSYVEHLDTQGLDYLMAGDPQSHLGRVSNRKHIVVEQPAPIDDNVPCSIDLEKRNVREKFIHDFWKDRVRRGSLALLDYCTPDFELHLIGDPAAIPFARLYVGLEAACTLVDQIDLEFKFISFEVRTVLIDREKAAVQWCADVQHRGTSAVAYIEGFDQIHFEGARMKLMTEFFDTAQTARCISG